MRRAAALVITLAGIVPRGPARADVTWQLVPEVEVGGGADTNPLVDTVPSSHELTSDLASSQGILHVAPKAVARFASSGHILSADYATTVHVPGDGATIWDHTGRLGYRTPGQRLTFDFGLGVERGSAGVPSFTAVDALMGSGLRLSPSAHVGIQLRGLVRRDRVPGSVLGGTAAVDSAWAQARVGVVVAPAHGLAVEPAYAFSGFVSDDETLTETRHRASLGLRSIVGRLTASLEYALAFAELPDGSRFRRARSDVIHEGMLEITVSIVPSLDLFARAQVLVSQPSDDSGDVRRLLAIAGMAVRLELAGASVSAAPSEVALEGAVPAVGGAPAGTAVRFRVRAPGASAVAVIGDFNQWDAASGPMARVGSDSFETVLVIPSGSWSFNFQVDGVPRVPRGADAYTSDGFGGRNAILRVP